MNVLVDMDSVLANYEKGLFDIWRTRFPDEYYRPPEERTTFRIEDNYPAHLEKKIYNIFLEQGFFLNLEPIKGGIEAVKEMAEGNDYRVFICTAPLLGATHCIPEKHAWIEKYLGKEFEKRVILTADKTMVRGHVLIDDKPEIKGMCVPEWEHLMFEQPYNRHIIGKRRINWSNWKEVLENA